MLVNILSLTEERVVLLDGGIGTELIKQGFSPGDCPELWNIEKKDLIRSIYQSYFDAGADIITTNSFGGSKIKLESFNMEDKCYELNRAAAQLASEIKPQNKWIAGSIGPTGKFLKPQGEYTESEFENAFSEQIKGLQDGGADLLLLETQYDLREALCAVRAAHSVSSLPIFATMTFNRNPRGFFTIMGNTVSDCFNELQKLNVQALGANCTLDSSDMAELVKVMRAVTPLPIIAQANAGQPSISGEGVVYSQGIEDYVKYIPDMINNGANFIGGCCGTDPDYIKRIYPIIHKSG